jgi:predicted O-methyltransferase YrrM
MDVLQRVKRSVLRRVFDRYYRWRLHDISDGHVIGLDYPVTPVPRYPLPTRPHGALWQWFDAQRGACGDTLDVIASVLPQLEQIPESTTDASEPHWRNKWFSVLDAMAVYALIARRRPARIVEIGSGNSTKFVARALRDHGVTATLTSVDPHPRAEIDALCTQVVRQSLESTDPALFTSLDAGDVLFVDGSHRVFTNSDVTAFFLDVLPALRPGVLVQIHDIFLPWDYPAEWARRYYSEQYMLACWLLAAPARVRLVMSNAFASFDDDLRRRVDRLVASSPLQFMFDRTYRYGGVAGLLGVSVWIEIAAPDGVRVMG